MKNVIIGTAGHVDHGKTLLIKALTGIDTDRLKEEKKRGITIELGFAYIDLPGGQRAGIIDVPGHEKFIKNMLAGAGGIDIAMLIVAADEGVMPQTREHLGILSLLNIKKGLVVVTKTDLVDKDWLELVVEEVKKEMKGSFLENAPVIPVSAYTGDGIEKLKSKLSELIANADEKNMRCAFRLPVDRVFSVDGFGTVITGTLIEGTVATGDDAVIYPEEIKTKVRNIQVHSQDKNEAFAGQRVAINLAGVKKSDIKRGDVIAKPDSMTTSMMLDVRLKVLEASNRTVTNGMQVHLYHGSREVLSKVVLLDKDALTPGESGYAQIRINEKIAAKNGDNFVIRFYSPLETIGGGVVLDANPKKHKRHAEDVIKALSIKESGSQNDLLLQAIEDLGFCDIKALGKKLSKDEESVSSEMEELVSSGKVAEVTEKHFATWEYLNSIFKKLQELLEKYHETYPLRTGMKKDEIRGKIPSLKDASLCDGVLRCFESAKLIKFSGTVALFGFEPKYSEKHADIKEKIEKTYMDDGYEVKTTDEICAAFGKDANTAKQVLDAMISDGTLVLVAPQICFHIKHYDAAVEKMRGFVAEHSQITLGELRDILGTSRKYAVFIIEYWDRIKLTKKIGDSRILAQ